MAYDFPNSPTVGQVYQGYVWDGQAWQVQGSAAFGAVRYDIVQGLTTPQQLQARTNIGAPSGDSAALTVWTPTITMSTVGGTPITAAPTGTLCRYKQNGKIITCTIDIAISNIGAGNSGLLIVSLPVSAYNNSAIMFGGGKEVVTSGKLLNIANFSISQVCVNYYDNTSLITTGNGTRINCGVIYEVP
jgi:hypothetical protein